MVAKLLDYYVHKPQVERFQAPQHVIRSYNECDDRIVDHDTKAKYSFHHTVGVGDLSKIIDDRARKLCGEVK